AVEVAHRRDERDRAVEAVEDAEDALHESESRLDAAEVARAEAERSLRKAEKAVDDASRDLSEANHDADRHVLACHDAYDRLDDPFHIRVAAELPDDWVATTFPEAGDLDEGRRLAAEIEGFESRLKAER